MSVITRAYSENSGTIAYASSVNRVIDDLYTLQNGNINSANIAGSGVANTNLETSAVISRAIRDENIIARHIEYSVLLFLQEVL